MSDCQDPSKKRLPYWVNKLNGRVNEYILSGICTHTHKTFTLCNATYEVLENYVQASLLGEAITGKGILAQLNLETGVPIYEAEPLLLFFILFTLLGAIGALGDRGRFVDDPPTGIEGAVIPPGKSFRSALGLKEGGM